MTQNEQCGSTDMHAWGYTFSSSDAIDTSIVFQSTYPVLHQDVSLEYCKALCESVQSANDGVRCEAIEFWDTNDSGQPECVIYKTQETSEITQWPVRMAPRFNSRPDYLSGCWKWCDNSLKGVYVWDGFDGTGGHLSMTIGDLQTFPANEGTHWSGHHECTIYACNYQSGIDGSYSTRSTCDAGETGWGSYVFGDREFWWNYPIYLNSAGELIADYSDFTDDNHIQSYIRISQDYCDVDNYPCREPNGYCGFGVHNQKCWCGDIAGPSECVTKECSDFSGSYLMEGSREEQTLMTITQSGCSATVCNLEGGSTCISATAGVSLLQVNNAIGHLLTARAIAFESGEIFINVANEYCTMDFTATSFVTIQGAYQERFSTFCGYMDNGYLIWTPGSQPNGYVSRMREPEWDWIKLDDGECSFSYSGTGSYSWATDEDEAKHSLLYGEMTLDYCKTLCEVEDDSVFGSYYYGHANPYMCIGFEYKYDSFRGKWQCWIMKIYESTEIEISTHYNASADSSLHTGCWRRHGTKKDSVNFHLHVA